MNQPYSMKRLTAITEKGVPRLVEALATALNMLAQVKTALPHQYKSKQR